MMRAGLILLFFVIPLLLPAQSSLSSKMVQGTWITDNGTFPDSLIRLRAISPGDSIHSYYAFTFDENGTVLLTVHAPKGQLMCGNGTPHLRRGSWSIEQESLRITLKGTYFAAGTFTYDLLYQAVFSADRGISLNKIKTFKNVRCTSCRN
jgi:hypothetical protein